MIAVVRSAGATVANKALQLVVQSPSGVLIDLFSASYQILSLLEAGPVQVFPAVDGDRQVVNMTTHRVGLGRYAAIWTPGAEAPLGRYTIRWFYQEADGGPELSFDQEFELALMSYNGPVYCTLSDIRLAGMTAATADDAAVQRLIVEASRYIEHYTRRRFYPQYKSITLSGRRSRMLQLDEPIVAVESVSIDYSGTFAAGSTREIGSYRVFNRHLTQNLLSPDDRENPKLEFLHGWAPDSRSVEEEGYYTDRFNGGVQNVSVRGVFGYTEPDGSSTGITPHLIRRACVLLCFKQRYAPGSAQRTQALQDARIKSQYTRDQGFILFEPSDVATPGAGLTHSGDAEVDAILAGFVRGPKFGSA